MTTPFSDLMDDYTRQRRYTFGKPELLVELQAERDRLVAMLATVDKLIGMYERQAVRPMPIMDNLPGGLPSYYREASKRPAEWKTPERIALLRELVPTDVDRHEIYARIVGLPGPVPSSIGAVFTYALTLGLRRRAEKLKSGSDGT